MPYQMPYQMPGQMPGPMPYQTPQLPQQAMVPGMQQAMVPPTPPAHGAGAPMPGQMPIRPAIPAQPAQPAQPMSSVSPEQMQAVLGLGALEGEEAKIARPIEMAG